MNIKLYLPHGPGSQDIESLVRDFVLSTAIRVGVRSERIGLVALAGADKYAIAVDELFDGGSYSNGEVYIGLAKTTTSFINGVPSHTILFRDYVFELILKGLSQSSTVENWDADLQLGPYIVAHELGHCKDHEIRGCVAEESKLHLPNGFDLKAVHNYYYPIFIQEFSACMHGERFYTQALLANQCVSDLKALLEMEKSLEVLKSSYDETVGAFDIALSSAALVWLYFIQYGKIWVGKKGTDFERESVVITHRGVDLLGVDALLERLYRGYPESLDEFKGMFENVWGDVCQSFDYLIRLEGDGWKCYWR